MTSARGWESKRARLKKKAAEYLAYEMWGYEKPNNAAVESAREHITKAVYALTAVGFRLECDPPTQYLYTPRKGRER